MISSTLHSKKSLHEPIAQKNPNKAESEKRSSADWQRLISEWKSSGLSQKKFCEQREINFHNFVYHRNRILQRQRKGQLAPVHVTSQNKAVTSYDRFILQLQNGAKLSIPTRYDSESLKALLTLLEVLPC